MSVEINDEYYDNTLFDLVDDLEGIEPEFGTLRGNRTDLPNILEVIEGIDSELSSLQSESISSSYYK